MIVLLELLTALLEYIDLILQLSFFQQEFTLLYKYLTYYAGIMLNAFRYLLCSKLCQHNRRVPSGNYSVKKKTGAIDVAGIEKQTGDNSFKRLEYWGIGSSYLIHYLGDHNAFVPCAHRNSKKSTKPFVRSAPHIKEKV